MPLYFFDIYHDRARPDDEGMDLPGDEEAWSQATRTCGEMIRDLDGALKFGPEWRMDVHCGVGLEVFTLRFSAESHR